MQITRRPSCSTIAVFFCLDKVPGRAPFSQLHKGDRQNRKDRPHHAFFLLGAAWVRSQAEPFSQRSERATACTIRMQIDKQINVQDELVKAKQNKLQITNSKLEKDVGRTGRHASRHRGVMGYIPKRNGEAECKWSAKSEVSLSVLVTR